MGRGIFFRVNLDKSIMGGYNRYIIVINEVIPMLNNMPVSYSGIQPSGNLTIGNYLGALRNFSE